MKHEFTNETPVLRLVFAIAALSITLFVGGFVDFLAMRNAAVDMQQRPVQMAERSF